MPRLQQYEQQVLPTGQTGGVRIPSGLFNAEHQAAAALGGAIDRLAKVSYDTSMALVDADMEAERRQYQIAATETIAAQEKYMADTPDYSTYQNEFNKREKSMSDLIGTMKYKANQKWAMDFLSANKPQWQTTVDNEVRYRLHDELSAEGRNSIEAYISGAILPADIIAHGGNEAAARMSKINEVIASKVKMGVWTKEQGESIRQMAENDVTKIVQSARTEAVSRAVEGEVISIASMDERGWDAAQEWLSDPKTAKELSEQHDLSISDITAILDDAKKLASVEKIKADQQEAAAVVSEMDAINQEVWKNTPEAIYNAIKMVQAAEHIDPEKKAAKVKELQDVIKRMGSGEFEPLYVSGSNANYNRMSRDIERDPRPYLDGNRLKQAVYDGEITMSQATLLQSKLDQFFGTQADKDPLKTDLYRRYSSSVDNIIKTHYKDSVVPVATLRMQEVWDKWVISHPDATPEEMQAAFEKIIQPEAVRIIAGKEGNRNGGLWRYLMTTPNQRRTAKEKGKTPYELIFGESPRTPDTQEEDVPMTATNPKTGERIISRDGGRTWQPM